MKLLFKLIVATVMLGGLWYFLSPLFLDKEINDELPIFDKLPTVEELTKMSEAGLEKIEEKVMELSAEKPDKIMEEAMPIKIVQTDEEIKPGTITSGSFTGVDSFHKGSGKAAFYKLKDDSTILRFEDFSVTNGPDLRVYLSEHPDPTSAGEVTSGESIELARLKGNKGNQNYEIPEDIDITKFKSVVIYCKPFRVIFATAPLQ